MSIWQVLDGCNTKTRMLFFCQHIGEFQVLQIQFQQEYPLQMRCISNQYLNHEDSYSCTCRYFEISTVETFNAVKEIVPPF